MKDPYPSPFTNEVLNIATGYDTYSFLDGYSGYHQISIALEDIQYYISYKLGNFHMESDAIWSFK
jgi:hypothetical protein